jgi:hypothetical protein
MKEILHLFTFAIGVFCLKAFVTAFRLDAVNAVPGRSKPEYCTAEASPRHGCRQRVFVAGL